jgi:hypothetical protein
MNIRKRYINIKKLTNFKSNNYMKNLKKMKIICLIIGMIMISTALTASKNESSNSAILISDYCDGWKDGYCEGWKDVKGAYAICPITPICPIPEMGRDRFKDGYNRGFKAGSKAALK